MAEAHTTLDRDEVARFAKFAGEWWDANGPFKPLHRINPVRLTYIRDQLCRTFGRDKKAAASLAKLTILDIGCGGGLVAEPLARLGAEVTGIDPAPENIDAAKAHAEGARLDIAYRAITAEALAAEGAAFDAVLVLEVIEHVPDVPQFLKQVSPLVKPGGVDDPVDARPHAQGLCAGHYRRGADPALAAARHRTTGPASSRPTSCEPRSEARASPQPM